MEKITAKDSACSNANHCDRKGVIYCSKCEAFFCEECKSIHELMLGHHKKYIIDNFENSAVINGFGMCPTHESYFLDSFCPEHYELCCTKCVVSKDGHHNGCKVVPFDDEENLKSVKRNLAADIDLIEKEIKEIEENIIVELKKRQSEFDKNVQSVKGEITGLFQDIKKRLDAREKKLLRALEEIYEERNLVRIIDTMSNMDKTIKTINAGKEAMSWEENDKDHTWDIVWNGCNTRAEVTSIGDLENDAGDAISNVPELSFVYDDDLSGAFGYIGDIYKDTTVPDIIGTSDNCRRITLKWTDYDYEEEEEEEDDDDDCREERNVENDDGDDCKKDEEEDDGDDFLKLDDDNDGNENNNDSIVKEDNSDYDDESNDENNNCKSINKWDYVYSICMKKTGSDNSEYKEVYKGSTPECTIEDLIPETSYTFYLSKVFAGGIYMRYFYNSVTVETLSYNFSELYAWKKCPENAKENQSYIISPNNPRIAVRSPKYNPFTNTYSTVIGSIPLSCTKPLAWNIKIIESLRNNGNLIFVGIAPYDIDQTSNENMTSCGWYLECRTIKLCSGPPHNYVNESYGTRKRDKKCIQTGDSVDIVVNPNAVITFIVNGDNYGAAYSGIPLDKPLVPCAILGYAGDSVELSIRRVK